MKQQHDGSAGCALLAFLALLAMVAFVIVAHLSSGGRL